MKPRSLLVASLILGLSGGLAVAQDSEEWDRLRSEAESHYELVLMLIKQAKFDEAMRNGKAIFELPFPVEKHGLFFESAKEISDALMHHKQHEGALEILQACLKVVSSDAIGSKLHQEIAYVYKKLGKDDDAMRHFQKSIELSRKPRF